MSANLDLVRSIYADWERGEYVIVGGPVAGAWTGLDGMAVGWRGWLDAWADYRTEAEEYRDLDAERVLVLTHDTGRGKASRLELGEIGPKAAALFHVHDDKVTRLVVYFDRDRALADLGLKD